MTNPIPGVGRKEHSWAIISYPTSMSKSRMDVLIRRSLELQKAETRLLPLVGRVIALIGTSSVGKSSIIAAMRARDSDLQETGADLVGSEATYNHFKINFPDELAFLQSVLESKPHQNHIHDAVGGGIFNFKASVSERDQLKAKALAPVLMGSLKTLPRLSVEEFEFTVLDRAMQLSLGGKACVFDLLNVDSVAKHALGRMPKKVVLIYCPLDVYVSRIQHRNRKAIAENELGELRLGVFHLEQMAQVFRPVTSDSERIIFSITRSQLIENFNKLFEDWNILGGVDVRDKYNEKLAKVLNDFGFIDPLIKSINYMPCFKGYNAIIDTSVVDPKTGCQVLLNHSDSETTLP